MFKLLQSSSRVEALVGLHVHVGLKIRLNFIAACGGALKWAVFLNYSNVFSLESCISKAQVVFCVLYSNPLMM